MTETKAEKISLMFEDFQNKAHDHDVSDQDLVEWLENYISNYRSSVPDETNKGGNI